MKIPFLDLKNLNKKYENEVISFTKTFLRKGSYINGSILQNFERNFAKFCGTKYCVGVGNGFDALKLILKSWIELKKIAIGDFVIVPSNTYIASILAIIDSGLHPKLVEPNLYTYNIETKYLKNLICSRTKAIMPVHLYGRMSDMEEICSFAKHNKLLIVEDCAQAHGAKLNGRVAGSFGDAGAFSFYPGKNLGAIGDAGCITTNSKKLYEVLIKIRNYGSNQKYIHKIKGVNSRLDDFQAGILNIKLSHLNKEIKARKKIAHYYFKNIKNKLIVLPESPISENIYSEVWHLFVIRSKSRKLLQKYLLNSGIETLIHYPTPPHKQKALKEFSKLRFPITEKLHKQVISLPIYSTLNKNSLNRIVAACNNFGK